MTEVVDRPRPDRQGHALVTGAAGGIGAAMARELAARGYALVLTDLSENNLAPLAADVHSRYGIDVLCIAQDLAAPGGAALLCAKVEEARGEVSVLVNCAGVYANIGDEFARPAAAGKLLSLHVTALTELSLYFGAGMARRGGGYILNLSSISSLFHDPSSLTYGASKNYVRFFSKSLSLELRPKGVVVSCLLPGGVDTGFFANNNVFIPALVRKTLLSAERCAKIALTRMFNGRRLIIPGLSSKAQALLFRIIVRPAFYGLVKKTYEGLKPPIKSD